MTVYRSNFRHIDGFYHFHTFSHIIAHTRHDAWQNERRNVTQCADQEVLKYMIICKYLLILLPRIGYRRFVLLSLLCGVSLKVVGISYKEYKNITSFSGESC